MTFEELAKVYVNLRETETMCSIWRQKLQDEISTLPQDKQNELEDLFINRVSFNKTMISKKKQSLKPKKSWQIIANFSNIYLTTILFLLNNKDINCRKYQPKPRCTMHQQVAPIHHLHAFCST